MTPNDDPGLGLSRLCLSRQDADHIRIVCMLDGLLRQMFAIAARFFEQRVQFLFPRGVGVLEIGEPAIDYVRWKCLVLQRDTLSR